MRKLSESVWEEEAWGQSARRGPFLAVGFSSIHRQAACSRAPLAACSHAPLAFSLQAIQGLSGNDCNQPRQPEHYGRALPGPESHTVLAFYE